MSPTPRGLDALEGLLRSTQRLWTRRLHEAACPRVQAENSPCPGQLARTSLEDGAHVAQGPRGHDRGAQPAGDSPELSADELLNADLKQRATTAAPPGPGWL